MKIYDCFYFFDELDLLEIRLNILDSYVDQFVLVEARETFNGKPKPLFYEQNKERYNRWNHKIKHYVVEDFPNNISLLKKALASPNTGNKEHWWVREFYQKESLINALGDCSDSDLIFISDVDEIWNPDINYKISDNQVYRPIQTAYPFYLNNRSDQHFDCWTGTRFGFFNTLKEKGPNHFRTERESPSIKIENGGWHFSWLGKKADKWDDQHPNNTIRFDLVTNSKTWNCEKNLPPYLKENKDKWKKLFLG
jgi:beta-1,4-mannosyl-glycoprotein beta-1,4-N-acetylglucosaminyltransferase